MNRRMRGTRKPKLYTLFSWYPLKVQCHEIFELQICYPSIPSIPLINVKQKGFSKILSICNWGWLSAVWDSTESLLSFIEKSFLEIKLKTIPDRVQLWFSAILDSVQLRFSAILDSVQLWFSAFPASAQLWFSAFPDGAQLHPTPRKKILALV